MAIVQIEKLTFRYPEQSRPVLNGLNLEVEEGEFRLITGPSGSGKSTLVKTLAGLVPDFYGGTFSGQVLISGRDIRNWDRRKLVREIGFLLQDLERQVVFDRAERDIAFGPENLGLDPKEIRLRIAEVCDYLGITDLLARPVSELSGGEKQKIALAGVLVMHPRILVLDEPEAHLDPASARDCLQILCQLHEDWGITVIACAQRTEGLFQQASRVSVLEEGRIVMEGPPRRAAELCDEKRFYVLPPVPRMFKEAGWDKSRFRPAEMLPLTVQEGRVFLQRHTARTEIAEVQPAKKLKKCSSERNAELRRVWVTYPPALAAVKDFSLAVDPGTILGIIGANGAGKSTLLRLFTGLLSPGRGEVRVLGRAGKQLKPENLNGRVGYLQQNPGGQLWGPTVRDDIYAAARAAGKMERGWIDHLLAMMGLEKLIDCSPRTLSQGEKVRAALAAAAAARPRLLVLDEPTRGLDGLYREAAAEIMKELAAGGASVLVVAHDAEFIGDHTHRLVLMLEGQKAAEGETADIYRESLFYASPAACLFAGLEDGIVSQRDAVKRLARILETERGPGH